MAIHRRISLTLIRDPAVTVARSAMRENEIVYVFTADKKIQNEKGRSRIVYIGKTGSGIRRVTVSAAERAETILNEHGVYLFHARIVHYPAGKIDRRQKWKKEPAILLERALIIAFFERYGELPLCNRNGQKMKARSGEFEKFSRARVDSIIEDLS